MSRLPIHFVSGLPRSGSTLLMNLLAQCPANHCTPTNDLIELVVGVQRQWTSCEAFRAQGIEAVAPKIRRTLQAMVEGFHLSAFQAGQTVFDKSRGWIAFIELIEEVLGRRVNVIVTVRDVRDMVASLELLHRSNPITKPSAPQASTIRGRAEQFLFAEATLGLAINRLKNAIETGLGDRLVIVPYRELVADPVGTIRTVHRECGLAEFVCDPSRVTNQTPEDDQIYGLPFHRLRSSVDDSAVERWREVLPHDVADWIDSEFPSVQALAQGKVRRHG